MRITTRVGPAPHPRSRTSVPAARTVPVAARAAPRAALALAACAALARVGPAPADVAEGAAEGVADDGTGFEAAFERAFDEAYRDAVALGAAREAPAAAAGADASGEGGPDAILAVLDATARFGRGGAALPTESRVAVERLARRLAALERVLSVRVIGHADNVGTEEDNRVLSERRALHVADLFRERWPAVHALAVGAGESTPIADNATAAGRAENRRVEIQVIGIGRPEAYAADAPADAGP